MQSSPMQSYELYTDGGCDPNPGPASAAGVCIDPITSRVCFAYADYLGDGTNNIGELMAILNGMKKAKERGISSLIVFSDSSLSVDLCTSKKQTTKPHLAPLVERIHRLMPAFQSLSFQWIAAHNNHLYNETADQLCSYMLRTASSISRGVRPPVQEKPKTTPIDAFFEKSSVSKAPPRLMLNCPFHEKDTVKALGAKWNPTEKKWVVADTAANRTTFEKWLKD